MTSNNEALYKAKQDWLDRLFASELSPATKCFAWGVFKRMYGVKIVSNPGSNTIYNDTKVGKSKHSDHRKKLAGCGAMSLKLVKNETGDWDSYEYTLNLNWDGNGALLLEGSHLQGTTPIEPSPSDEKGSYPEGTTLPPTGYGGTTQGVGGVLPTGSSNTINNTTKNTVTKTLSMPPAAAEESLNLDSKEESEDISLVVIDDASPLLENNDAASSLPVVEENATNDVEEGAPAAPDDEIDWDAFDAFADYTPDDTIAIEKPAENGGVPEDIMNILSDTNNPDEAIRLFLDPEFRSDKAEDDETRARWCRDFAWEPTKTDKVTSDSSHDDEW